ncbi:MAG TPA: hypothetical protein VE596_04745 [Gaiellaceae bacterium]|nr:hypothetical protein [Gaiellaceae bacterium]
MTVLALAPLLLGARRQSLALGALGLVRLAPYVPLGLAADGGRLHRVFDDLVATGRARRLPITIGGDSGRLLAGYVVAVLLIGLAAAVGLRSRALRGRLLCALGLFAALQIPYALWRADAPHLAAGGLVAFTALPAAVSELASRRPAGGAVVAGAAVLALFLGIHYLRGGVARNAKLALGRTHSHLVSSAGRDFRIDDAPPRGACSAQSTRRLASRRETARSSSARPTSAARTQTTSSSTTSSRTCGRRRSSSSSTRRHRSGAPASPATSRAQTGSCSAGAGTGRPSRTARATSARTRRTSPSAAYSAAAPRSAATRC